MGCALFLQIIEGKVQAHFIMDDPAGNSYLQVQPWAPWALWGVHFPGMRFISLALGFPLELWARADAGSPAGFVGVPRAPSLQQRGVQGLCPCPHRTCTPRRRTRS